MSTLNNPTLPTLLAGPIIRHCDSKQVNYWLVTSVSCALHCRLIDKINRTVLFDELLVTQCEEIQIGQFAFIQLISIAVDDCISESQTIEYDIQFIQRTNNNVTDAKEVVISTLTKEAQHLLYASNDLPNFMVSSKAKNILHGSCRKPHFPSKDGLALVDDAIQNSVETNDNTTRPSLLMMSGDQVYCDDVAGPMLVAIHQIIDKLGLFDEQWTNTQDSLISNSQQLFTHKNNYYQRQKILPKHQSKQRYLASLFSHKQRPIFHRQVRIIT